MANGTVQVAPDSTGKKVQTFENTIGGQTVEAQAVAHVDSTGVESGTAGNPVRTDPTGGTTQPVSVAASLPAGNNNIGDVDIATMPAISGTVTANIGTAGSLALDATLTGGSQKAIARGAAKGSTAAGDVTSTNVDANTQGLDVSVKGTVPVSGPLTDAQIRASALPVSGPLTDAQLRASAVPVTANAGTNLNTSALALDATLTGGTQQAKITDGTNVAAVKAASTAAAAADKALVVGLSPNSPIPAGSNAIGSVTANVGTTNGLALDATLTGGTAKSIARGGAKGATTAADITGTAEGADHQAVDVQIYHGGTAKDPTAIRALTSADVVTSAQGTAAAASGAWPAKVTDGTNVAAVKAASTAAVAGDPSLVVGLSPNSPIPTGSNTIGALTANQSMNMAQAAGTTLLTGNGVTGAGSPRVTIASDNTAFGILASGDVDHDAVNTAKVVQVGGYASPADVPPALVSASGDRARSWVDRAGASVVRTRRIRESYSAAARLAETTARLDLTFTFTANTNKQLVTLHHASSATKDLVLARAQIGILLLGTAAGQTIFEIREINTAPATGNPAVTPKPHRFGGGASEGIVLCLPGTAGTEVAANGPLGSPYHVDYGIMSGTTATANPLAPTPGPLIDLYNSATEDPQQAPPSIPLGTLGGWAITGRSTAAVVLRFWAVLRFYEEIP